MVSSSTASPAVNLPLAMPAVHRTGWLKALVVGTAWILVAVVEIYVEPAGLWMRGHAVTDLVVTDGDRREVEREHTGRTRRD